MLSEQRSETLDTHSARVKMTVSWRRCVLISTEDSLRVMEKISKARQSTQAGWEADLVERLGYDGRVGITRDVACQSRSLWSPFQSSARAFDPRANILLFVKIGRAHV